MLTCNIMVIDQNSQINPEYGTQPTRMKIEIHGVTRATSLDTNMSCPLAIPVIKVNM